MVAHQGKALKGKKRALPHNIDLLWLNMENELSSSCNQIVITAILLPFV